MGLITTQRINDHSKRGSASGKGLKNARVNKSPTSDELVATLPDVPLIPAVDVLLQLAGLLEGGLLASPTLHAQPAVLLALAAVQGVLELELQRPQ